jgi:hypothetical protein
MTTREDLPTPQTGLGPKRAEFGASNRGQAARVFFGLACCGLGIAMLVALVFRLDEGRFDLLAPGLFVIALCAGIGVSLLRGSHTRSRTLVEVYKDGLVLREGEDDTSCRWIDVLAVTEVKQGASDFADWVVGVMKNETHSFHLHLSSGQVIVLKDYISDLARLGDILKQETLPRLLAAALEGLDQGRPVDFGPIRVRPGGIEVDGKTLPWEAIQGVKRKFNWFQIHRRGGWVSWKKFKLGEVPNAHVLEELVARIARP